MNDAIQNQAPEKPARRDFVVTLRFQYPAWDEKDGIPFYVQSRSKKDAIDAARRQAYNDGHLCGGKGRVTFSAKEEAK